MEQYSVFVGGSRFSLEGGASSETLHRVMIYVMYLTWKRKFIKRFYFLFVMYLFGGFGLTNVLGYPMP